MRISIKQAIHALQSGQVIGVPTETVYGLAASLYQPKAIEQIFSLKGRPRANPLIVHIADVQQIERFVQDYPPGFFGLAKQFWPGPLTCILPVNETSIPEIVRSGLPTAGFRIPAHELTRDLLRHTGPLVMPSANLSGRPSATRPEHIEADFGINFPVIDGGMCTKGLESTILIFQNLQWKIARLGALSSELFQPILGYQPTLIEKNETHQPLCPGQFFRHYAPKAYLFLGDRDKLKTVPFILGFKERSYPQDKRILILGSLNHPEEVAENLYQLLRQLDEENASHAWIDMDFPQHGLWQTIAERLKRAGEATNDASDLNIQS